MLALSACSNSEASATPPGCRPRRLARRREPPRSPAVAAAEPDYPQPVVVIPPRPKPGAPHGPGFDMPLIELGGYAPVAANGGAARRAHIYRRSPGSRQLRAVLLRLRQRRPQEQRRLLREGARPAGARHGVGTARRRLRGVHRHRRRLDEDEEFRRVGDGDSQESSGRLPAEFPEHRNADAGPTVRQVDIARTPRRRLRPAVRGGPRRRLHRALWDRAIPRRSPPILISS